MSRRSHRWIWLLALGLQWSLLEAKRAPSLADEDQAKRVVQQWVLLWNQHDPAGLAELCDADADIINPFGKWAIGQSNIRSLLAVDLHNRFRTSELKLKISSLRFLSDEIALVDLDGQLENIQVSPGERHSSDRHMLFVLIKSHGTWKISAVRPYRLLGELTKVN